jgi:23S rRNA (pseudouridine1915-N3)-methyltransferase
MKNLTIRAIGKPTDSWQREAIHMYAERLRPFADIQIIELPEGHDGSAKPNEAKTREIEAVSLLKGIPNDAFVIALDETGKSMASPDFSKRLADWSEGGRTIVFLIGGSWGLHENAKKYANFTLSFGPMTLPHNLARIVLLEQIYRAAMIQSGKTYGLSEKHILSGDAFRLCPW